MSSATTNAATLTETAKRTIFLLWEAVAGLEKTLAALRAISADDAMIADVDRQRDVLLGRIEAAENPASGAATPTKTQKAPRTAPVQEKAADAPAAKKQALPPVPTVAATVAKKDEPKQAPAPVSALSYQECMKRDRANLELLAAGFGIAFDGVSKPSLASAVSKATGYVSKTEMAKREREAAKSAPKTSSIPADLPQSRKDVMAQKKAGVAALATRFGVKNGADVTFQNLVSLVWTAIQAAATGAKAAA